jgi:dTDP-4-dehydrorhamnose 3,5-epimerase-like enzyme
MSMQEDAAPRLLSVPKIGNPGLGYISIAESERDVPFEIKRVFWTYYTPQNVQRGGHAHRQLEQLIFAVSGRIEVQVIDGRRTRHYFQLDDPSVGLYMPPLCWADLRFSHNAVLMCLASMEYVESECIRTYEEFLLCL